MTATRTGLECAGRTRVRASAASAFVFVLMLAGCSGAPATQERAENDVAMAAPNRVMSNAAGGLANAQAPATAETNAAAVAASPDTPLTARGWGPLTVGMTRAAVTKALGASAKPDLVEGPEPEKCAQFHPRRAPDGMIVMLEDERLTRVSVGKGPVASDRGIQVGDPVAKVRAAYEGDTVEDMPHTYQNAPARYLTWWAPGQTGKYGIRYEINSDGRVGSIHAGGPSIRYVEGCL